jgi:hypothetical protein
MPGPQATGSHDAPLRIMPGPQATGSHVPPRSSMPAPQVIGTQRSPSLRMPAPQITGGVHGPVGEWRTKPGRQGPTTSGAQRPEASRFMPVGQAIGTQRAPSRRMPYGQTDTIGAQIPPIERDPAGQHEPLAVRRSAGHVATEPQVRKRGSHVEPSGQQPPSGRRREASEHMSAGASHVRRAGFQRRPGGHVPHQPLAGIRRPSGQRGAGMTHDARSQFHTVPKAQQPPSGRRREASRQIERGASHERVSHDQAWPQGQQKPSGRMRTLSKQAGRGASHRPVSGL